MKKFLSKIKSVIPAKRRLIQLYAALLFNANLKGFKTGVIYQGPIKNVCTPGLHCYSCPGATGACPMGALQNALTTSNKSAPYYMLGIIMLYGLLLGRWICGFLCPFGFIQDLIYKIKTPKLKKNRFTRFFSYFKYVILIFFVIIFPLAYMLRDFPLPAFCKYICPAGTLGGAIGLLINPQNEDMLGMLGPLFTWKFLLLVGFIVGSVFIYRFFCRFFCPLGALYGLFNKFAICGIKLEKPKCIDCGKCISKCKMDITHVGDHECINCGECISVCPTNAIRWKGSQIILPDNEIPEKATEEEREVVEKKRKKRTLVLKIVAAVLMISLLTSALVYYNFIDKNPSVEPPTQETPPNTPSDPSDPDNPIVIAPKPGNTVGKLCYDTDLEYVNGFGEGTLNITEYRGKTVILNFWGTWCGPCKSELPAFNKIASDYKDKDVVVITIHTSSTFGWEEPEDYINTNLKDSEMIFLRDSKLSGAQSDNYYTMLGGRGTYPMTIVLNADGIITYKTTSSMEYEDLAKKIDDAKGSITSN